MTRLSKEHMTRFMPCVNVLVAQSCLSLHPMDCSLPGSSIHGISQQKYWSGLPFPSPGNLPDSGVELALRHCRQILYHLSHQEITMILGMIFSSVYLNLLELFWLKVAPKTKQNKMSQIRRQFVLWLQRLRQEINHFPCLLSDFRLASGVKTAMCPSARHEVKDPIC